jgi:hypothetical protein
MSPYTCKDKRMTSTPTRICAREGCSFPIPPDSTARVKYCCAGCRKMAFRQRPAALPTEDLPQQYCKKCGREFPRSSHTNQKFCSRKCRSDYNNEKRDVSTRVRGNWNLDHCPFKACEVRMYDACGAVCARMSGVWGF